MKILIWAAAAEYADSIGVDIINSSLGYTILYDDTLNSHSYFDMDGNSTIITQMTSLPPILHYMFQTTLQIHPHRTERIKRGKQMIILLII